MAGAMGFSGPPGLEGAGRPRPSVAAPWRDRRGRAVGLHAAAIKLAVATLREAAAGARRRASILEAGDEGMQRVAPWDPPLAVGGSLGFWLGGSRRERVRPGGRQC
eukprot:1728709-Alexandrium_andersonii.AAC.1